MKRLVSVIGTRPQYIKYAAISQGLDARFETVVVDTGQHYDAALSRDLAHELGMGEPGRHLGVGSGKGPEQLAWMLEGLQEIFQVHHPHAVLCLGDTNSTLAAALAAVKSDLPVIHLEAGERTFSRAGRRLPVWVSPEETNRVLTDQISGLLLCASRRAVENLAQDGAGGEVVYTGDILYDLYLRESPNETDREEILQRHQVEPDSYYYCTVHRAVNTDHRGRLEAITEALTQLDREVILALHPRTRKMLFGFGLLAAVESHSKVRVVDPVSYRDSLALAGGAHRVLTDSGGVLREAFFAGVPSVCLDDSTAWIDVVDTGWSRLTGADLTSILAAVGSDVPTERPELFGDGTASSRTVDAVEDFVNTCS